MPSKVTIQGKKLKKGKSMTRRTRWEIVAVTGRKRSFKATLLKTINFAGKRIAIFSVPKFPQSN